MEFIIKILLYTLGIAASATLYRMGGAKGYNTKFRDFGCPLVFFGVLSMLYPLSWLDLLAFGAMFGALTTYWDFLFKEDNFWFHGFMIGMSTSLIWSLHWYAIVLYSLALAVSMGLWSQDFENDVMEELGRGAFIILWMWLLFL